MKNTSFYTWIFLIVIALAPWLGGSVAYSVGAVPSSEWFSVAFFDRSFPSIQHAFLGILILISGICVVLKKRILLLPNPWIFGALVIFWVLSGTSFFVSENRYASLQEFTRVSVFAATYLICIATLGRVSLVALGLSVLGVSVALVGLMGISEFIETSRSVPNWRIFAGWQNPNAAAGLFAITLPIVCSFAMATHYRPYQILSMLSVAVIGSALLLTASKGGLLSAVIGVSTVGIITMFQTSKRRVVFLRYGLCIASIVFLFSLVSVVAKISQPGAQAAGRLAAATQEVEQSAGYRLQLWKDTVDMAVQNATTGVGIGTYQLNIRRYSSLQPPVLAHNTYLQMASESGLVACAAFVFFIAAVLRFAIKKHPASGTFHNLLRIGLLGALVAGSANMFIESSLSFLGFSILFAFLLACSSLVSFDGAIADRAPFRFPSFMVSALAAIFILFLMLSAYSDIKIANAQHLAQRGLLESAITELNSAKSLTPLNPEPLAQLARIYTLQKKYDNARSHYLEAISRSQNSNFYVALAKIYALQNEYHLSNNAFLSAIERDPANPALVEQYLNFLKDRSDPKATDIAKRLVAMETSPYVTLNPLPQFIPTSFVSARIYLADKAKQTNNTQSELEHLLAAFNILANYREKTYVQLKNIVGEDPERLDFVIAGESMRKADEKFAELQNIANRIIVIYEQNGKPKSAMEIKEKIEKLKNL